MKNTVKISSFRRYFEENLGFKPTDDQNMAMEGLTDFLWSFGAQHSDGLELFILTGYAGTGKTSLIGGFVNTLYQVKIKSVLLAPTGRAAKVLSNYSQTKASTIHRKIYFKNEAEGSDGFTLGQNKHTNTIFVVDEASMISTNANIQGKDNYGQRNLLDDLIEYVYSGQNCKLIFVGDKGQLPPIGMAKSPALEKSHLKQEYSLDIFTSELNEIVRQEETSGILDLAGALRNFTEEIPMLPVNTTDARAITGMDLSLNL